jgi:gamma-glutamylcyclotransferase (GGCT)/AIG2-like uncharacterized protein YtfP
MASDNLKNEVFQVFVYGTLKPGERAYQDFCEPFLVAKEEAKAPGRLYHLPMGYPAMTLESGWVFGVCLTFKDPHVLRLMDEFEDYFLTVLKTVFINASATRFMVSKVSTHRRSGFMLWNVSKLISWVVSGLPMGAGARTTKPHFQASSFFEL